MTFYNDPENTRCRALRVIPGSGGVRRTCDEPVSIKGAAFCEDCGGPKAEEYGYFDLSSFAKKWEVDIPYYRIRCSCDTPDDWYPTKEGKVTLTVVKLSSGVRICIWGGDDFGLEKDQQITFGEALKEADAIPVPITQEWLRNNGYINA